MEWHMEEEVFSISILYIFIVPVFFNDNKGVEMFLEHFSNFLFQQYPAQCCVMV